jgi:hypothetical protein
MVLCLRSRKHIRVHDGERHEFRIEEWADADGEIFTFVFATQSRRIESSGKDALARIEDLIRRNGAPTT